MWHNLVAYLMQVDLLMTKTQRFTILAKRYSLHAKDARVKAYGRLDVADGEHEMV
jgi:hypothetical protein